MRVRGVLCAACVGALAVVMTSCGKSSVSSTRHDAEAGITLDSDCATLTVTNHAYAHRGQTIKWEIHSNCKAANQTHAQLQLTFDPQSGRTLPVPGCPCDKNLNDSGLIELPEQIDANADLNFPFKYKVTLYGASVDPDLEIDP